MVNYPPADAGDIRDESSIPGSGRSPAGGHGNPVQCSSLENLMDRGASMERGAWPGYRSMTEHNWLATVHRVTKNWMLSNDWVSTHTQIFAYTCVRNFHVKGSGIWKRNQEYLSQNFPGGPMTRTLHSQGRELTFHPWSGKVESTCLN